MTRMDLRDVSGGFRLDIREVFRPEGSPGHGHSPEGARAPLRHRVGILGLCRRLESVLVGSIQLRIFHDSTRIKYTRIKYTKIKSFGRARHVSVLLFLGISSSEHPKNSSLFPPEQDLCPAPPGLSTERIHSLHVSLKYCPWLNPGRSAANMWECVSEWEVFQLPHLALLLGLILGWVWLPEHHLQLSPPRACSNFQPGKTFSRGGNAPFPVG